MSEQHTRPVSCSTGAPRADTAVVVVLCRPSGSEFNGGMETGASRSYLCGTMRALPKDWHNLIIP
jgi:hypothetical protein